MNGDTQLRIWKLCKRNAVSLSASTVTRPRTRKVKAASNRESVTRAMALQNENARQVTNLRRVKN